MMNMLDTQDKLKNFSEQQLVQEMQSPSGGAPQFMVLGEIERRQRMRQDATRQEGLMQPTVAEEAVNAAGVPQQGIASMAQAMAPQTNMGQNTGVRNTQEPVKMAEGGRASFLANDPATISAANAAGMSVNEYISRMPEPQPVDRYDSASGMFMSEMTPQQQDAISRRADLGGGQDSGEAYDTMLPSENLPVKIEAPVPTQTLGDRIAETQRRLAGSDLTDNQREALETNLIAIESAAGVGNFISDNTPDLVGLARSGAAKLVDLPAWATSITNPELGAEMYDFADRLRPGGKVGEGAETGKPLVIPTGGIADLMAPSRDGTPFVSPQAQRQAGQTPTAMPTSPPQGGMASAGQTSGGIASAGQTSGGSGKLGTYEEELMSTLKRREEAREQDKWLALAEVGLGLLGSNEPNFGTALGQAGLQGAQSYRASRDQYDTDRMGILKEIENSRMANAQLAMQRAAAARRASGGGGPSGPTPLQVRKLAASEVELGQSLIEQGTLSKNPDMVDQGQVILNNAIGMINGTGGASGVDMDATKG